MAVENGNLGGDQPVVDAQKESAAKRPKVLVLHPALAPYRIDTFNAMAAMSDLELILIKKNVSTQAFDQNALLAQLDFTPHYLNKNYKILGKRMAVLSYKDVMGYRPDIVITSEFSPTTALITLYKYLSGKRFANVVWTDDNISSTSADRPLRRLGRWLLTPFADGWIFVAGEARELYQNSYGARGRHAVVPILRRHEDFSARLESVGGIADRYITDHGLEGKRVVLFVGRLVEEKGIDLLLRAFAQVRSRQHDAVLVIVGSGEKAEELAGLAESLGIAQNVRFVGRFEGDTLLAWYRVGQVFALGSRFEPFGAVVNEALLAGLPAIVSNKAGAKSLVSDGVNGAIVSTESATDFASAIETWLADAPPLNRGAALPPSRMRITFETGASELRALFQALMK